MNLRQRIERHRQWMNNDEETINARNKLMTGQPLTKTESEKLFKYIKRLEFSLDKVFEK